MIRRSYLYIFWLIIAHHIGIAQVLENDLCTQARTITIGEKIVGLHNIGATTTLAESPETIPISCVKTFENDLWFKFTTVDSLNYYEVSVNPVYCNTPAGLQAMIIRADECVADSFVYRACANPREEQLLQLFMEESTEGLNFFIYVDGFDGTECGFTLELSATSNDSRSIVDHKKQQMEYYKEALPPYEPVDMNVSFLNNEATIRWEDDTQSDIALFQVHRVYNRSFLTTGSIIAHIEPTKTVGVGTATYSFSDNKVFLQGESYCYRIVKIDQSGNKSYTESLCIEADLIKDLYVTPITPTEVSGKYIFRYINKRKQDLSFIILDKDHVELKRLLKKKEPKQDGDVTVDMNPYGPGIYYLRAECKEGYFLRKFVVE